MKLYLKQFVYAVILVIVLGLISVNTNSIHAAILPPLKQIASGVLPEDVVCSDGLVLVKKVSKETVVCVKPQTADKLIERGWGTKTLQSTQITNQLGQEDRCSISSRPGVDWSYCGLEGRDLSGANLTGANLHFTNLHYANLVNADLRGVDAREAHFDYANLTGQDLRNTNLAGAVMTGADLRMANLNGTNLYGTTLSQANLEGANLSHTYLNLGSLVDANAAYANFEGSSLSGTSLQNANLNGANLKGAIIHNFGFGDVLNGVSLQHANLVGVDLEQDILHNVNMQYANLTGAKLNLVSLIGANLTSVVLRDADLRGADLSDADLTGADLIGTNLIGTNLNDAKGLPPLDHDARNRGVFKLSFLNNVYDIPYKITDGRLSIMDKSGLNTMRIFTHSTSGGNLEISLPRELADPMDIYGSLQIIEWEQINPKDLEINCDYRTISYNFSAPYMWAIFFAQDGYEDQLQIQSKGRQFDLLTYSYGSICDLNFNQAGSKISFTMKGAKGIQSPLDVVIPNKFLSKEFNVIVDGTNQKFAVKMTQNYSKVSTELNFSENKKEIEIVGELEDKSPTSIDGGMFDTFPISSGRNILYRIDGGLVKRIVGEEQGFSIFVDTMENGTMNVELPRLMDEFQVLIDGKQVGPEVHYDTFSRILTIPFTKGNSEIMIFRPYSFLE